MTNDNRMTIVEHLQELRRVLIVSLIAWVVATAVSFAFHDWMLTILLRPLHNLPNTSGNLLHGQAIFLTPTEGLTIPVKIAAFAGFVLSMPIILWQVWTFVAPGLRPVERKFAAPFIATSLLLFVLGGAFAYFVMPLGLNFLAGFLNGNAVYFPDVNEYLSFLVLLIVVFGITFELPIVIILLGVLGITSSRWLRARRKAIYVGIIGVALVVTPGADPFTPTALAIPLIIFFEIACLILDKVLKR